MSNKYTDNNNWIIPSEILVLDEKIGDFREILLAFRGHFFILGVIRGFSGSGGNPEFMGFRNCFP